MSIKGFRDEAHYRETMAVTLGRIEKAFYDVDPDIAECNVQFGALTILFPDGSRCILSSQPSVGQLWMAIASKGIAYHFDYDPALAEWRDDKGDGVEPLAFLKKFMAESAGLKIQF